MKKYERFHRNKIMRDNWEMGKIKTNPEYSGQYWNKRNFRNERDFITPSFSTLADSERKEKGKKRKNKIWEIGIWTSERTAVRTGLHCIYLAIWLTLTISILIFGNPEILVMTENTNLLQYISSTVTFIWRCQTQKKITLFHSMQ